MKKTIQMKINNHSKENFPHKMNDILQNNIRTKWVFIILILLISNSIFAQQEPTYTQYMFNTQTINPAYAGTWGATGFMVLAREQWTGIEEAPSTQTLSFQTLHKNKNVGWGLNVINDKFGFEKRLSVFGDYSYLVRLDEQLKLRLGLKIGFSNYTHNLSEHTVLDANDPMFMGEIGQNFMPNFGIGGFLYKEKYYIGLALPKMVQNEFKNDVNNFSTQAELRHMFLMGGYVFDLSENVKFKPTILGKIASGAPAQVDFTTNFLISDRVWLGAMLRTGDSFGFLAQWIINNNLRFGYSVDFATSELSNYQNGTHEIMISYEISKVGNLATRLF